MERGICPTAESIMTATLSFSVHVTTVGLITAFREIWGISRYGLKKSYLNIGNDPERILDIADIANLAPLQFSGFRIERGPCTYLWLYRYVGVSIASLRPHHGRPCNTALVASARMGRFQGGSHGFSRAARSCCAIFESADSRRRPVRSSPTSFKRCHSYC